MLIVLWASRNIKSLFPLKDKVAHRSCVIYEGKCSCKLRYIRETKGNSEVRWKEHEDPGGKSEPSVQISIYSVIILFLFCHFYDLLIALSFVSFC